MEGRIQLHEGRLQVTALHKAIWEAEGRGIEIVMHLGPLLLYTYGRQKIRHLTLKHKGPLQVYAYRYMEGRKLGR